MDLSTIVNLGATAASGLASATGAAQGLASLLRGREASAEEQKAVVDLWTQLIELRQVQAKLEDSLRAFEKEQQLRDDFAVEAKRYQLEKTAGGGWVQRLKREVAGNAPLHDVCTKCFADRRLSILQPHPDRLDLIRCPSCRDEIRGDGRMAEAFSVPTRRGLRGSIDDFG